MKKVIAATMLSSVLLTLPTSTLPAGAVNGIDSTLNKGYVSVSYTAEKEVSPDTVEVSISVKTDDKKSMQEAVRKNKEISDKVYSYLKSVITPANGDYVKTSNFSASPSYIYNNNKRTLDKYNVSNNVIVHTKSIDKISTIIDNSLSLGATDVDSLNFLLSEKDTQCADLLSNAAKQARKRADIVATSVGSSVVGIKNIDTTCSLNNSSRYPVYRNSLMMAKAESMDGATSETNSVNIEAGTIKIYSNVNASFYLK
ncbi:MAG: SIMPL domain-containing protein [Candidatus Gastranaerophilaceae bacterium]